MALLPQAKNGVVWRPFTQGVLLMDGSVVMALQLRDFKTVTVGGQLVCTVPGDVVVDDASGERRLLHKIEFEDFVEKGNYSVSGDMGLGWVVCKKV